MPLFSLAENEGICFLWVHSFVIFWGEIYKLNNVHNI